MYFLQSSKTRRQYFIVVISYTSATATCTNATGSTNQRYFKFHPEKAAGHQHKKERVIAFTKLKNEISRLQKDKFENKALNPFDIVAWLESKISGKSFAEVVRENKRK